MTSRFLSLFDLSTPDQLQRLLRGIVRLGVQNTRQTDKKRTLHVRRTPSSLLQTFTSYLGLTPSQLVLHAMAHRLDLKEARQDPVKLPPELFIMVLSFLDTKAKLFVFSGRLSPATVAAVLMQLLHVADVSGSAAHGRASFWGILNSGQRSS